MTYRAIVRDLLNGNIERAERTLKAMLARDPNDAEAIALSGRAAGLRGDHRAMLECFERAVRADPRGGEHWASLARCRMRAQDVAGAMEAIRTALALEPLSDLALDALAGTLAQMGYHDEAAGLLQRAEASASRNPAIHYNLGNYLKFTGEFAAARAAYGRALTLAPDFVKAHAALAALGGADIDGRKRADVERLITRTRDPRKLAHLHHAAARLCDGEGRYDESWEHLKAGKNQLIRELGIDSKQGLPMVDRLIERVNNGFDPGAGEHPTGPILILGMPRSGTTVLDRMISNHDGVVSIGETLFFAQALKSMVGSRSPGLLDTSILDAIDEIPLLREAGRRFTAYGQERVGMPFRFLDKFHLNILLAPHLLRALPNARMLCVVRDPMDTIVSNYRQLFEFESNLYHYALDVEVTAEFYVRFRRLAALLAQRAPDRFRIVDYARIVAAPEDVARALLRFCGLPWQPGCSQIERNVTSVATASAVQVRGAISGNYVGRWRHFAAHLEGARGIVTAAGFDAG